MSENESSNIQEKIEVSTTEDSSLIGKVKWFNNSKGFGFIEHENGDDVFVHYSVISSSGFKTLKDGEEVLYEMERGEKGWHAVRVRRKEIVQENLKTDQTTTSETLIES